MLTVLQRLRPVYERLSNLFTPDTLRRWHREFVRRKWDDPHPINKRKTIPLQGRSRLHLALLAGVDSLCAVLIDQDYTIYPDRWHFVGADGLEPPTCSL